MNGCQNCGNNSQVQPRCTDVKVVIELLGNELAEVLVDGYNTAISLGADRSGSIQEFEFNRQLTPPLPPP